MKKENKSLRIIIDTNLWISFLLGKCLSGLHNLIYSEKIVVVTCKEQFIELSEVLSRPKLRKYFSEKKVDDFFDLFDESTQKVGLETISELCRDSKDNFLVSLSIDSDADFLLTGDKDLLELKMINRTGVITFKEFEELLPWKD